MERIIQFTETDKQGRVQQYVARYANVEMDECFTAHERLWLSQGKIVEREHKYVCKTEIVDLQAWFLRTKP